jgi:hypothetical protein
MPAAKAAWVRLPLRELKANPNNPRVIKDDKFRNLVQSIREFPQMLELRPIVVNGERVVLGGNMRLKACKEAGLNDVPVVIADDLTPAQQREFVVKDNASFGEWDWDELANEWAEEPLSDWGLDVPEQPFELATGNTNPDEYDEIVPPCTTAGDMWCMGEHRLICGDTTDTQVCNAVIDGAAIGAFVFDPPFEQTELIRSIAIDEINATDVFVFGDCMNNTARIVSTTLPWVFQFVWDGVTRWVVPSRPLIAHKTCDWFAASPAYDYDKVKDHRDIRTKATKGTNKRGTYEIEPDPRGQSLASVFKSPITSESHGAEHAKPVLWIAMILGNCSRGVIFDCFAGSGTTLIAAQQLQRPWRGIELNPSFCDVIVTRWQNFTGKQATHAVTGQPFGGGN